MNNIPRRGVNSTSHLLPGDHELLREMARGTSHFYAPNASVKVREHLERAGILLDTYVVARLTYADAARFTPLAEVSGKKVLGIIASGPPGVNGVLLARISSMGRQILEKWPEPEA